jgi:hypothetical protein
LNAEQQLYSAMRDLSKARADAVMQGLKLKAAAGALLSDDLQVLEGALALVQKPKKPVNATISTTLTDSVQKEQDDASTTR